MEEFFILKCPESSSINKKIKNIFVNKFRNDGIQLRILDEENEDDNIYNYTSHIENNFCGSELGPSYIKNSVYDDDNFSLMKFLNYDDVHSIITFKIMTDHNKNNLQYMFIDAYCANQVKQRSGASILLDYLVDVCKNIGISEIRLDSTSTAKSFYEYKGFNEISSNSSKMVKMINGGFKNKNIKKNIKKNTKKNIKKNTKKNIKKNTKKNKNKKYNFKNKKYNFKNTTKRKNTTK
jgi:hypothetical protein